MKLKIIASTALAVPLLLATTVKAQTAIDPQPLPTVQPQAPAPATESGWKEFSSTKGGFAVSMPGTPAEETETDDDGSIAYSYTVLLEEEAYIVNYSDVPEVEKLSPEDVNKFLEGAPDDFVKGAEAQLLGMRNVTLNGNPGKEFEFSLGDGIVGKGRVYLVQQRLFLVVAIAPQTPNLQKFLDSFRFL